MFFRHGRTEMFLKHQRELTKCVICKILPNTFTTYHLSMNNDNPTVTVGDEVYIICKICEKYIHFKCYSSHLKLSAEQGQQDLQHIRSCGFTCHLCRCNRLKCPLARMSGLQCFNMGHNGNGINLYGVSMTLMEN